MKVLICVAIIFSVFTLAFGVMTEDFDVQHRCNSTEKQENECMGEKFNETDEYFKAQQDCLKEKMDAIKAGDKDRKKGMTCLAVCEWQKMGLLDSTGKFNTTKADGFLKSLNLSDSLTKKIHNATEVCLKAHGSKLVLDPKDKKCSSYKNLVKCDWNSYMKVCDPTYDEEDWEY